MSILGGLLDPLKTVIDKVVPDANKKLELNLEIAKLEDQAQARLHEEVLAQIEVNKTEASSGSVFVAGWRPAIGWVGAGSLAYAYIVAPFLGIWVKVPAINADGLYNIIIAMLGVGVMRTVEKVKGVSTNDYTDVPKTQKKDAEAVAPTPIKKKKFKIF